MKREKKSMLNKSNCDQTYNYSGTNKKLKSFIMECIIKSKKNIIIFISIPHICFITIYNPTG